MLLHIPQAGLEIKALLQLQVNKLRRITIQLLPSLQEPTRSVSAKEIHVRFTKFYHIFLHPHALENPSIIKSLNDYSETLLVSL